MKKTTQILLLLMITNIVSCNNDNEPKVYNNINGSWICKETIPYVQPRTYIVDIDRLKDTTQYIISNFYSAGENEFVFSKLTGSTLKISDNQSIGVSQMIFRSGSGVVSDDFKKIVFDYKIYDGFTERDIHAVYTR